MYIVPDVSEFQDELTGAYTRDALIFRGAFGTHKRDNHLLANANRVRALWDAGRLNGGAVLYTVFLRDATPAEQFAYLWNLIGPKVPDWLTGIMLDVETWRGNTYAIAGDHSSSLNALYGLHAHRMGSFDACKGYGNVGDLAELWPARDPRCEVIVAGYVRSNPMSKVRGAIGWQYTNGSLDPSGLPSASGPFGHCDHNVFPGIANGAQFRALWGRPARGAKPAPPTKPKPAPTKRYTAGSNRIVSANREHALYIHNDGRLALHRGGKVVHTVAREK